MTLHPIAARLKAARIEQGLSVGEVATRGRFSRTSLIRWEDGTHAPVLVYLAPWAEALGLQLMLAPAAVAPDLEEAIRRDIKALIGVLADALNDDQAEHRAAG